MQAAVIPDWIINAFKPDAVATVKKRIAALLAELNPGLRKKLSARLNLGDFLKTMMNPARKAGSPPVTEVDPLLAYTSWDISSSGIVLHGTLSVPRWPRPKVDFDYRVVPGVGPLPLGRGEYNALRSWIPGGTIQEFVWHQEDGPTLDDDKNRFIFDEKPGMGPLFFLCLTITGKRITASAPIAQESVTAESFCSWRNRVFAQPQRRARSGSGLPQIALTGKQRSGGTEVVGHMSPWTPPGTAPEYTSNLIVHFPDQESLARLEWLTEALKESGRSDTSTAIVAVLNRESFAHVKPADGILFADDVDAWAEHLEVNRRPATVVWGSNGHVVWRQEAATTSGELAAALEKHLVAGSNSAARLLIAGSVVGQASPNFLFDSGAGGEHTLRKLIGRPVVILFWSPASTVSVETLRELERSFRDSPQPPVLLAVSESGSADEGTRAAGGTQQAIVVPDVDGEIARAYGIAMWPTTVFVDASGLVSSVRYGRFSLEATTPGAQAAD